ncbi:MAG: hypothetical protein Roseis2KO_39390 [Roseivirga sp.]
MRKLNFVLCLLLLFSSLTIAQDVLVKINGEKLEGKADIAVNSLNQEYATVKVGRKKKKLSLLEVREIRMANGDVIKPINYDNKYKFGKELISGYLSHYRVTRDNSTEKFNMDLLYKMDGTHLTLAGKMGFRSAVRDFLGDCVRVADGIQDKQYTRNGLDKLVNDYNACVSKDGLMSKDAIEEKAKLDLEAEKEKKRLALSKSLEQKLADFATLLEYSDRVSNKGDVTAMFNDVSGKLRKKEPVPNYLQQALKDALKTDPQLLKLINEILNK